MAEISTFRKVLVADLATMVSARIPFRPVAIFNLHGKHCSLHPVAFQIGGLTVHWYGVLVALGFFLGFWTAGKRAQKVGISSDTIMDMAPWILVAGIVGARILHVISYWDGEFAGKPFKKVFMIQEGGLVFYGGFIAACLTIILYCRWKKLPLWKLADVLTPSLALGHFFGRLGCFTTGCCFGKECSLPWAVTYPQGHEIAGIPVHPTQIYEALANLALYAALAWFFRRKTFDGQVFALYLLAYSILRSIIEVFRADYKPNEFFLGRFTPGQTVSIGIFLVGIILFLVLRNRPPSPTVKNAA